MQWSCREYLASGNPWCESTNPISARRQPASQGSSHVDCLNALWKLSVQGGLSDPERIRAMLAMAAQVLDMDLVVLGEFGEHYIARYVSDRLGVFPEGTVLPAETALCHVVHQSGMSCHIEDLATHPLHAQDVVVTEMGMRTYSGIPVSVGDEARWVLAFLRRRSEAPPDAIDIAYMGLIDVETARMLTDMGVDYGRGGILEGRNCGWIMN